MRKILLTFLVSAFLLTGCFGGKKLTCTMTGTEEGMETSTKVVIDFKNDKATKVDMEMKMIVDEEAAEYLDFMVEMMKLGFAELEEQGWEVSVDTNGNTIIMKMIADISKLEASASDVGLFDFSKDASYEDTKKDAEAEGFTCK